ncbi:MAG: NAD-dependent epimerase/dehydratase family protein [Nanoarchaeota archaeon]|nr:NAD-dependent epimerase/dehydratase family protein [Nanoarchaeota archaeon]
MKDKENKKLNILITGGTGFVGSNLVNLLRHKEGYSINVLSQQSISSKDGFVSNNILEEDQIIIGDLLNYNDAEKATNNIDIVIHLAYSKNYPENLVMAENLINACRKNKVKKIILLSSMSAKRSHPDEYGKNKLEIENMIKKSGINYTILRPSIIYGKGGKSFDFMIELINKVPFFTPIIGSGKYWIMPVHKDDVIKAVEKTINNKITDKKEYDLPGRDKIYFVDLINLLKKEKRIGKINIHIPIMFCKVISMILPKVLSKENIRNLTESSLADMCLAEKDLDYKPISLKEGLKNGIV